MITRFHSARIVLPDGLFDGYVYVENGKITAVTTQALPCDREIECGEHYLAPGLIDMHVHGGKGHDFGKCNAEEAADAVAYHRSHGTTTILPTLASAPMDELSAAVERLIPLMERDGNVAGMHLEGPYFALSQCGAQNTDFITDPIEQDYLPFLEKYGKYVRRWSYAPERDDGTFCDALTRFGVLPSAGHTDALGLDLRRAAEHGCRLTTHLFSCTSTITREGGYRRTGVLEETLLNDEVTAEIITDGCHLPHDLIKLTYKVKGREKVTLCSDALSAAGQDITEGELNGVPFIVEDGVCRLIDRTAFCGSIATGDRLVRTCVAAGISLVDSIYMAAATPADLLGLPKGRIKVGLDADLIVFDENINVQSVYIQGEPV